MKHKVQATSQHPD